MRAQVGIARCFEGCADWPMALVARPAYCYVLKFPRPSCRWAESVRMTMIYLANCLAITFVPPWMIYKYKL